MKALFLILIFMLGGCADDEKIKLKAEVKELRQHIEQTENLRALLEDRVREEDRRERATLVAQWCDFLIPTCPSSMVAEGRQILKLEPGKYLQPRDGQWLLTKIMLLLAMATSFIVFFYWFWLEKIKPSREETERAKTLIQNAKNEAEKLVEEARKKVAEHEQKMRSIAKEIEEEKGKLMKLAKQQKSIKKDVAEESKNLEKLKSEVEASKAELVSSRAQMAEVIKAFN